MGVDPQSLRDFEQLLQRGIALPSLDRPQILIVQSSLLSKGLLGELRSKPEGLNPASQLAPCLLLLHTLSPPGHLVEETRRR